MSYNRRSFIKLSATFASGLAFLKISNSLASCNTTSGIDAINQDFGLQLYTLRDEMPKDPRGVLRQVASFGYKQLESYEHNQLGMFWGMEPAEFKNYVERLGMRITASHADIYKDFERKAGEAASIGMHYLICPSLGSQKTLDDYKKAADKFNECGEICKRNGLRFAYHNHDYTFKPLEGQIPQDVLMQNTGADLVDYEMDIYWVVTAGQDPLTWLNKYPNRFTLGHIKDRRKDAPASETGATTILGTGSIDYNKILKAASSKGMKYYFVEQEHYAGTTPIDAARANAEFMKNLKL